MTPGRKPRQWTAEEDEILISEYEKGAFFSEIGRLLNVQQQAVRHRFLRLVRQGRAVRYDPLTKIYGEHSKRLQDMVRRCYDSDHDDFKNYGARGVAVCDDWNLRVVGRRKALENFTKFAESHGYKPGLTIDRIDPFGNYEPSNCRFITIAEQQLNKRKAKSSRYIGVSGWKSRNWATRIVVNKRQIHIGAFATELDAARAYDSYVRSNGLSHLTNFPADCENGRTAPQRILAPAKKSRFNGVKKDGKRWRAIINVENKTISIGSFDVEEDAARAFDAYVIEHGLHRRTNFVKIEWPKQPERPSRKKASRFAGVYRLPKDKWFGRGILDGRPIHLGTFPTEEAAARAVDRFIREHGLDRPLNFPD